MIIKTVNCDRDILASKLISMGTMGRHMPPSWDRARISVPVVGPQGQFIGKILPGRGLYLDMDLKTVAGIHKPLPHVYQKTMVMKLRDAFRKVNLDERAAIKAAALFSAAVLFPKSIPGCLFGAIATYDQIIAARAANGKGEDRLISKSSFATVANQWFSAYRVGGMPSAGTYSNIPGGAAHNRASDGAWSQGLSNPTGGNKKYLLTLGFIAGQQINAAFLIDLLVGAGNILATATGAQTVNSAALTRYTTGEGVLMTFEVTTALGTGTPTLTIIYTNQAGTGTRTATGTMTASATVQRLFPIALGPQMELQSGDFGVRSVQSAELSAGMTAGIFALNLYFPLAMIPGLSANTYVERDSTIQIDGISELVTEAGGSIGCLAAYVLPNTTSIGTMVWQLRTCAG